ncbi:Uncharacterised protein [Burkholderia pseudomallei]|nr:Uncharacterised protein [Burkholderia pseudomallei]CAJ9800848.1 Uncharacterised protein [Burkholderia pseudomallei]
MHGTSHISKNMPRYHMKNLLLADTAHCLPTYQSLNTPSGVSNMVSLSLSTPTAFSFAF